ncbi:MAG: cupin domain-containing protein [Candidatus Hydrogenedentota bacterium]
MRVKRYITVVVLGLVVFAAGWKSNDVAAAKSPRLSAKMLWKQDLSDIEGKELMVIELNVDPGAGSPAHKHPGHTVGYVIEGEFEMQIDDDPIKIFKAGEVFYEPNGVVHTLGRNPSETETAKVIVFMLKDADKPATALHRH